MTDYVKQPPDRSVVEDAFNAYRASQREHVAVDDDVALIIRTVSDRYGVELSEQEAISLWRWYSEDFYAASWLGATREEIIDAFYSFMIRYGSVEGSSVDGTLWKVQKEAGSR